MALQHSTAHYRAPQCCCQLGSAATWRTHLRSRAHARHTGKRCDGGGIKFANSCDVIKQHFPCKMCWKSQGSDQPCYVSMMNAPPEKHPGDCMIEGTHTTHACNTAHTAQHSTARYAPAHTARYAQHTLYAHTLCTLHPHHPHHTTLRTTHTTLRTPSTLCPCLCCSSIICLHCTGLSALLCSALPLPRWLIVCHHIMCHHIIMCVWFGCVCVWFRFGVVESMRWEVHHDLTAMPMRLA